MLYYISNYKPWLKTWGDYNGGLNCRLMTATVYIFLLCRLAAFLGTERRIQVLHLKCLDCALFKWLCLGGSAYLLRGNVVFFGHFQKCTQSFKGWICVVQSLKKCIFKHVNLSFIKIILILSLLHLGSFVVCLNGFVFLFFLLSCSEERKKKNKQTPASHDFNSQVLRIPM